VKDEELDKLRPIQWRTQISQRVEEFSRVIADEEIFKKYYGESYAGKLASRSKELFSTMMKLFLVYALLMLPLFFFNDEQTPDFLFLGYGFKNFEPYKEFLLVLAASILPLNAALSAYQNYLNAIAAECIKKLYPDEDAREFYSLMYFDSGFGWIASLKNEKSKSWHGAVVILLVAFAAIGVALFSVIYAGSIFVQISVVVRILTSSEVDGFLRYLVPAYVGGSILFSWLIYVLQLPLPLKDFEYYSKLQEIKGLSRGSCGFDGRVRSA